VRGLDTQAAFAIYTKHKFLALIMLTGHVFIAASLDGFIARQDGTLDWLFASTTPGEDHGYDRFMERIDGVVMGRNTYETALGFGDWPYTKPVVVMSQTLTNDDLPDELRDRVQITDEAPRPLFERLTREGWRRAYVDGGAVIRSCLDEGLIEEVILTRAPVLIGEGLPLFGATTRDLRLVHEATEAFPSGLVQSRYRLPQAA
jgi:dihydrofolate reductase